MLASFDEVQAETLRAITLTPFTLGVCAGRSGICDHDPYVPMTSRPCFGRFRRKNSASNPRGWMEPMFGSNEGATFEV